MLAKELKAYCCPVFKDELEHGNIVKEEGVYYLVIRNPENEMDEGLGSGVPIYYRKMNGCFHCLTRLT